MNSIDWFEEVNKNKDSLISDLQELLRIRSVLDEKNATEDAPLGKGVKDALDLMLEYGQKEGFKVKNVGNVAGHIEFGQGAECVGILCHVDVVPEGDGWSSNPFSGEIREGKIYARGAIDDKGPTMAAFYGLKIVKDLGLSLSKRVRLIVGTDEESNWRCVEHYFEHEEMPTLGFAPDADFPIINAEKGISDFDIVQKEFDQTIELGNKIKVINFRAGRRYNMVPDFATVSFLVLQDVTEIIQRYLNFLLENKLKGNYFIENGELKLQLEGISVHGMEPDKGINAGLYLAKFISELKIDERAKKFFHFINMYFVSDSRGRELSIAYSDEISGDLTINVGKLSYNDMEGGRLGLNLRYPVTMQIDKVMSKLEPLLEGLGFGIENFINSNPHYVDENEFLIETLKRVYEDQTGVKAECIAIGGGTYARSLRSGVAFGPLFPGRKDCAHQKDEHMFIEDLLKAAAIYAQAIYELAK